MAQVQFIQAKLATAGGQQTSGPAAAADQYTAPMSPNYAIKIGIALSPTTLLVQIGDAVVGVG